MNACFALALAVAAVASSQLPADRRPAVSACVAEHDAAERATGAGNGPDVRGLRRDINRAFALYRFHRSRDARAALDAAGRRFTRRPRLFDGEDRATLDAALSALRSCLSSATPPALATLSLRATFASESVGRADPRPAGGAYVWVDDIPVGRTSNEGLLTARVPSGSLRVAAIVAPNAFGSTDVRLSPGAARALTIDIDEDKEPALETDLVLAEAEDGVLRSNTKSVTLRFLENDRPMPVRSVVAAELLDSEDNVSGDLTRLFAVSGTSIVAVDRRALFDAFPTASSAAVRLRIAAVERATGLHHSNIVEFTVGR